MSSWINLLFLGGIALQDLKRRRIDLVLLAAYAAAGVVFAALRNGARPELWLADLAPGALLCAAGRLSRGGIGAGDGIAVLGLGLMTGIAETLAAVLGALVLCTAAGAFLGIRRKTGWKTDLPYTPFLAAVCLARVLLALAEGT